MEAPEKIYLEKVYPDNGVLPNGLNYSQCYDDIEYTRTDAFIEKACEFLNSSSILRNTNIVEKFKNYMKGE